MAQTQTPAPTTVPVGATPSRASTVERPARRLRTVLAVDAGASLATGVVGLVAAPTLTEELGLPSDTWTRTVSALLVLWALDLALIAARSTGGLRSWAMAVAVGNVAYVAATGVLLATSDLTTAGRVVAVVLAVAVADLAVLQLWFRHRAFPAA